MRDLGTDLTSIHLLVTYRCDKRCAHCFVFGSPEAEGEVTGEVLSAIWAAVPHLPHLRTLFLEGGEPTLLGDRLTGIVAAAARHGLWVGMVSNGSFATDEGEALRVLRDLQEVGLRHLSLSQDAFHGDGGPAQRAAAAARSLGLGHDLVSVGPAPTRGRGETFTGGPVEFRGRAAVRLAPRQAGSPGGSFTACPLEEFMTPDRLHIDPLGHLHLCQGISIGRIGGDSSLRDVLSAYDPSDHPVVGPLLTGGPARLLEMAGMDGEAGYADACHACFAARERLRERFPEDLAPAQMYGEADLILPTPVRDK